MIRQHMRVGRTLGYAAAIAAGLLLSGAWAASAQNLCTSSFGVGGLTFPSGCDDPDPALSIAAETACNNLYTQGYWSDPSLAGGAGDPGPRRPQRASRHRLLPARVVGVPPGWPDIPTMSASCLRQWSMDARDVAQMTAKALNDVESHIDSKMRALEQRMDHGFREIEGKIDRNQRIVEQKTDEGFRQIVDYLDRRLSR